jgi:hypothetical protein
MADDADAADRGPVDHLLDFFVFAPLGLLAESHTIVPKLAEAGRQQVESRVQLARMVGQFAVAQGRRQVARVVDNLRATNAESSGGSVARRVPASDPAASAATEPCDDDEIDTAAREAAAGALDESGIAEEDLAIPSYDSLAASQVVPRLDGLTTIELEAVRRYELAHRGRRTVLGKIALLQSKI